MILITVKEAAKLWGVDPSTVREWARTEQIKATKHGRSWIVRQKAPPLEYELGKPRGAKSNG